MSEAANALITAEEYRGFIGQESADGERPESLIESHIGAASEVIARYTNRTLIAPAAVVEQLFDGNGTDQQYLPNWPIFASPTPTLKWYDGTAWQTVTGWLTVNDRGMVYFPNPVHFYRGRLNYKFTYIGGYAIADVPADMKYACAQMVFRQLRKVVDKQEGVASESFDTHSVTFDLSKIPTDLRAILDKHKAVAFG